MSAIKNISLYVPHIFANFDEIFVKSMFGKLGKVSHVDFVGKIGKDGRPYNAGYIHFEYWYNTPYAVDLQALILDPNEEAHFVYDEPWYWIVLENKRQKIDRKIRINIGDLFKATESVPSTPAPNKIPIAPGLSNINVPGAPVKTKVEEEINEDIPIPINLEDEFDYPDLTLDEIAWLKEKLNIAENEKFEMSEIQKAIEEEEDQLREAYIMSLEEENRMLRAELEMLQSQPKYTRSYNFTDEL